MIVSLLELKLTKIHFGFKFLTLKGELNETSLLKLEYDTGVLSADFLYLKLIFHLFFPKGSK